MRIWHLILSVFVFSLLVILSGCSDDNGSDISDTKYHTKYEYSVTLTGDWADVCKATAYTVAFNEHKPTQTVDFSNEVKWTYENGTLPDSTGVLIEFTPDNVDGWNKDVYTLGISRKTTITVADESGTVLDSHTSQSSKSVNIRKDMLSEYLARPLRMTGKVDANGSISFSTEIDFGLNTETVDIADFEEESAVPVFIGLTEKTANDSESLLYKPIKISSMADYSRYFGERNVPKFKLSVEGNAIQGLSVVKDNKYLCANKPELLPNLYNNLKLFFANGGGACYIISIGNYTQKLSDVYTEENKNKIFSAIQDTKDITMISFPEASNSDICMNIYNDLLDVCKKNGIFAILDIPQKSKDDNFESFRSAIGTTNLQNAAAYYPWLETSVLSDDDINEDYLIGEFDMEAKEALLSGNAKLNSYIESCYFKIKNKKDSDKENDRILTEEEIQQVKKDLHNALMLNLSEYRMLANIVRVYLNKLPPSAAMAGIYTMVDNTRGVWKAPANVPLNCVNKPSEIITDREQEDMNMPMDGKVINAIRIFFGEGIKIWGARTLDGNSLDWRYINVRRSFLTIEKSLDKCINTYFLSKPNNKETWSELRNVLDSYCHNLWKRGALAGAQKEEAYEVHVGVGDTMSQEDISKGTMRVTLQLAFSRPYEFIEITKEYKMQQ